MSLQFYFPFTRKCLKTFKLSTYVQQNYHHQAKLIKYLDSKYVSIDPQLDGMHVVILKKTIRFYI
jgi:hypothetical protein